MDKTYCQILLILVCIFLWTGCVMDSADIIAVKNHSQHKIDVLINENYPDTSLTRARLIKTAINPSEEGPLGLVNRKWEDLLKEKEMVTIFFVERKPIEFYDSGRLDQQHVYGKLILSQERLVSLGGEIIFPDDLN